MLGWKHESTAYSGTTGSGTFSEKINCVPVTEKRQICEHAWGKSVMIGRTFTNTTRWFSQSWRFKVKLDYRVFVLFWLDFVYARTVPEDNIFLLWNNTRMVKVTATQIVLRVTWQKIRGRLTLGLGLIPNVKQRKVRRVLRLITNTVSSHPPELHSMLSLVSLLRLSSLWCWRKWRVLSF